MQELHPFFHLSPPLGYIELQPRVRKPWPLFHSAILSAGLQFLIFIGKVFHALFSYLGFLCSSMKGWSGWQDIPVGFPAFELVPSTAILMWHNEQMATFSSLSHKHTAVEFCMSHLSSRHRSRLDCICCVVFLKKTFLPSCQPY